MMFNRSAAPSGTLSAPSPSPQRAPTPPRSKIHGPRQSFRLDFLNIRGLKGNLSSLHSYLTYSKPDLFGLVETFTFADHHLPPVIENMGYTMLVGFESPPSSSRSRPKGGIALLVKKTISQNLHLVLADEHVCWYQLVSIFPLPLFVAVCYFPNSSSLSLHAEIYTSLKAHITDFSKVGFVLLMGDFNARSRCNGDNTLNSAGKKLLEFIDATKLICLNSCSCCHGSFTRFEAKTDAEEQKSTIDYVLADRFFLEYVTQLQLQSKHDALAIKSDHVTLSLFTTTIPHRHSHCTFHDGVRDSPSKLLLRKDHPLCKVLQLSVMDTPLPATKFDWQRADFEKLSIDLEKRLRNCKFPSRTANFERMTASSYVWSFIANLHASVRAIVPRKITRPQRKARGKTSLLCDEEYRKWWKLRQTLLRNGKSNSVDAERLKMINRNANRRAQLLLKKLRLSDYRETEHAYRKMKTSKTFWAKLHRLRSGSRRSSALPIEHSVVDKNGKLITDSKQLLEVWSAYYEEVYWVPSSTDSSAREEDRKVALRIQKVLDNAPNNASTLDRPLASNEIAKVLKQCANGKAAGEDELPYELFKNLFSCDNTPELWKFFVTFLNLLLRYGIWPEQFQRGIIGPIYKKKGNRLHTSSFRPISLLSCLSKIYEGVLNSRLSAFVEKNKVLAEEQAGFRSDRSTLDNVLTLDTIISTRLESKLDTFVAFLDVEKAYDRTWRERLLIKLLDAGIDGMMFRSLYAMLQNVKRAVRIGTKTSSWFETNCGVPQGSILSPLLFDIFIDEIAQDLKRYDSGVCVNGVNIPALLYADDLSLQSDSVDRCQNQLRICERFAQKARLRFNVKKSNVVVFSRNDSLLPPPLQLQGQEICYAQEYQYLGVEIGNFRFGNKASRWDTYLHRIVNDAHHRCNEVLAVCGREKAGMSPHIGLLYYYTRVRSRLEYACQIWGVMTTTSQSSQLEDVQKKFARRILHLPEKTPYSFCMGELNLMPLNFRRWKLALRLWGRICTLPAARFARHLQRNYFSAQKTRQRTTWFHYVRKLILQQFPPLAYAAEGELSFAEIESDDSLSMDSKRAQTRSRWNREVEKAVKKLWHESWLKENRLLSSLRFYNVFKLEPKLEPWLTDLNRTGIDAKVKLRSGMLELYSKKPLQSIEGVPPNYCPCCLEDKIETRSHFLLHCPSFERLRRSWFIDLQAKMKLFDRATSATFAFNVWSRLLHLNNSPGDSGTRFSPPASQPIMDSQVCFFLCPALPSPVSEAILDSFRLVEPDADANSSISPQSRLLLDISSMVEKNTRHFLHLLVRARRDLLQLFDLLLSYFPPCNHTESSYAVVTAERRLVWIILDYVGYGLR
jgi:hypothetical protein